MATRSPKPPAEGAHESALRLLAVRARSRCELADRLRAKGFEASVIEALLERLTEAGLLDDGRFARERARHLGRDKGFGPRRLRVDLARRGLAREVIDEALAGAYESTSPEEVLRRLAERRFGTELLAGGGEPQLRARAYRYLVGRGFEPQAVYALLGEGD